MLYLVHPLAWQLKKVFQFGVPHCNGWAAQETNTFNTIFQIKRAQPTQVPNIAWSANEHFIIKLDVFSESTLSGNFMLQSPSLPVKHAFWSLAACVYPPYWPQYNFPCIMSRISWLIAELHCWIYIVSVVCDTLHSPLSKQARMHEMIMQNSVLSPLTTPSNTRMYIPTYDHSAVRN